MARRREGTRRLSRPTRAGQDHAQLRSFRTGCCRLAPERLKHPQPWNQSLPGGAMLIGSVVQITLDIEAVQGDLPEMPDA